MESIISSAYRRVKVVREPKANDLPMTSIVLLGHDHDLSHDLSNDPWFVTSHDLSNDPWFVTCHSGEQPMSKNRVGIQP